MKLPIDLLSKQEFRACFHILDKISIHLVDDEVLSFKKLPYNSTYFSKKQFVARLRLLLPSFFKQFLHVTQIPPVFLHPNVVQVLMGCNIMDMLFQLDISLLEALFIYTVKMSQKKRFSLSTHIPSLQLVTRLPNSNKDGTKRHVFVSGPWRGLFEGLNEVFTPQHSLEIPSRICLYNFCLFFVIISLTKNLLVIFLFM